MAYLYFVIVCLFFGSNFILMDRATRWFGPIEIGLGRVASAAALLAILWATLDRKQRLAKRDLGVLVAIALISNAYPYALQPAMIASQMEHSFFGMMMAFVPLLTILVSIPMLGVKPTARQLVGVVLGFAFIVLLMYDGHDRGIPIGLLALAGSVPLSYAVGNTWIRRSLSHVDSTPLTVVMLLVSTAALAPLAASRSLQAGLGVLPPAPREDFVTAAAALAMLGAAGTGLCMWAFIRLIQDRGPLFAGMVTYVIPVVALTWGWLDREPISLKQMVAIAGILSMVALVQSAPAPEKRAIPEPAEALDENGAKSDDWAREPAAADA